MTERISLFVNGQAVESSTEVSVASAVMQANAGATRQSIHGEPRGPLCGMGVCFDCRVTIDGAAHQRSCQRACEPGMQVETAPKPIAPDALAERATDSTRDCGVLVVGAGPAGIAAACTAAEMGRRVTIIDDNPQIGGQIWRHDPVKSPPKQTANWFDRLARLSIEIIPSSQVIAAPTPLTLVAETPRGTMTLRGQRIILACGAREHFLPFPGWTLPGVFGAGGLQALVKSGYGIGKKKIVVAGTGPLLLAVAAYLRERGAIVDMIAEQARFSMVRFGAALAWNQPGKFVAGLALGWHLRGITYRTAWPVRAHGTKRLEAVTLTDGEKSWNVPCDALACGFGLVANLELPVLLGCAIADDFVQVNERQATSVPHVYAIGELTGIGGLDKALLEGQIAGWSAADRPQLARNVEVERRKTQRFVNQLADTFSLRDELRRLPDDDTIVCRCEDVTFGQLRSRTNWRDAKLQTRCGMGPCQGRICGPAVQFLFGWHNDSVRPPLFPTTLANLA